MSVNDSVDANRYMDTEATLSIASDTCILLSFSKNSYVKFLLLDNGVSIHVTHTNHSKLSSKHCPLHLHNILITPNVINNLICVCCFTTDNHVSIKFDPFGFSMKDLETLQVLIWCESSGDLYPIPSSF